MQCPIRFCEIFCIEHYFEALIHYFTHFLLCLVCIFPPSIIFSIVSLFFILPFINL
ncbi:hypothetical protein E2C01_029586 [Portunus trituberculatus]|uniref:Uncharacterized protein n=1 Tax=Portunus trituberculatus TaxID=210409 RepID=A0A5B7ES95_PORTR|nr:hypothetical protein [Portunus trituberculatus]